jgi:signal transduction protein with GAF and PtsI domain
MPQDQQPAKSPMNGIAIIDEISRAIIGAEDIGSIAYLILDLAINYTEAEKGSLMLLDNRGQLYIHSARGINHELSRDYRLKVGEGIAGRVAAEQR